MTTNELAETCLKALNAIEAATPPEPAMGRDAYTGAAHYLRKLLRQLSETKSE